MSVGLAVALALLVLIAAEQLLTTRAVGWYYAWTLPIAVEPLPIDHEPEGEGRTASVRWVAVDGEVRFWAASDGGLVGLHGVVQLVADRGRIRLLGRWAPPWSLLVFAFAGGAWGTWLGVPLVSVAVAGAMALGSTVAYQAAATRALAELRWSFVREDDPRR